MILREHLVKNDIGESSDFSFATITPYHPSWASGRDIFSHEDITFIEHEEVEKTHDNSLVFSDKWNQVYERNEKHEVELSSCGFVVSAFISVR